MAFPTYTEIRRWPGGFAKGLYDNLKALYERDTSELVPVSVNVSTGNANGSSAADSTLVGGKIVGYFPAGNQDQHVDNVVLNANGSVTVTLAANATAQNQFKVTVEKPKS